MSATADTLTATVSTGLYFGVDNAFFTAINSINYIWSFVVGFVVYMLLMKTGLAGRSHVTEEEYAAMTKIE